MKHWIFFIVFLTVFMWYCMTAASCTEIQLNPLFGSTNHTSDHVLGALCMLQDGTEDPYMIDCYEGQACIDEFRYRYPRCPGRYCGRVWVDEMTKFGKICESCPAGTRTDGWVCVPCNRQLSTYDVFYFLQILFVVNEILVVVMDFAIFHYWYKTLLQWLVFFELIVSGGLTILIWGLQTQFTFRACPVLQLADFFPAFYNPINCACARNEVVYPIFSLPMYFIFVLLAVFGIAHTCVFSLFRKRIVAKEKHDSRKENLQKSRYIHFSLTFVLPGIFVIHYLFSGIFYYALPYLIIASWLTNVMDALYVTHVLQKIHNLVKEKQLTFKNVMRVLLLTERYHMVNRTTIMLFRWASGSLGFYAMMVQLTPPNLHLYWIILAIIVPPAVYFCMMCCTTPATALLYYLVKIADYDMEEEDEANDSS